MYFSPRLTDNLMHSQIPFLRTVKRSINVLLTAFVQWKMYLIYLRRTCCVMVLLFQVIVEKAPKARIGDLDKKKYLVPSDLTGCHCIMCQVPAQYLKHTSMLKLKYCESCM